MPIHFYNDVTEIRFRGNDRIFRYRSDFGKKISEARVGAIASRIAFSPQLMSSCKSKNGDLMCKFSIPVQCSVNEELQSAVCGEQIRRR